MASGPSYTRKHGHLRTVAVVVDTGHTSHMAATWAVATAWLTDDMADVKQWCAAIGAVRYNTGPDVAIPHVREYGTILSHRVALAMFAGRTSVPEDPGRFLTDRFTAEDLDTASTPTLAELAAQAEREAKREKKQKAKQKGKT